MNNAINRKPDHRIAHPDGRQWAVVFFAGTIAHVTATLAQAAAADQTAIGASS
jgi:hypothetical protein